MKRTLGLLLALMVGCSLSVTAQQVTPPSELEFGQVDDLLIDPAAFEQLDAIEKNKSLTDEVRMAARCLYEYAKIKAVKLKDTASVHVKEHKKTYITSVAVAAAVILFCWLRHAYGASKANNVAPQSVKPALTGGNVSDVPRSA